MTVKELIKELEQIENKELDVVILGDRNYYDTDIEVIQTIKYYSKIENDLWTAKNRECILLTI